MGARAMVALLRQEYQVKVPEYVCGVSCTLLAIRLLTPVTLISRSLMLDFFRSVEPDSVKERNLKKKTSTPKRPPSGSEGVMEVWAVDQHDRWGGRFGLWCHVGTDPFSGRIAWLKVWWCNRNPRLLMKYYLDAGRQVGGMSFSPKF